MTKLCKFITVFLAFMSVVICRAGELVLAENTMAKAVIVVPANAGKPVSFAARELKQFLDAVTGANFTITDQIPAGETAIILGDCPEARAAGIDVTALKRDGFRILRKDNQIFIAGRDDKDYDLDAFVRMDNVPPHKGRGWQSTESKPEYATLFGVYDFLERIAGVRFYFPGELGTFIPKTAKLTIDALDITENPAMIYRFSLGHGDRSHGNYRQWRMPDYAEIGVTKADSNLWSLRCRQSTFYLPQNHGEGMLRWHKRFWENPARRQVEFFALKSDGSRYAESQHKFSLCYTNPAVIRQMAADATVFFSGKKATQMLYAPWNAVWVSDRAQGNYFSIMPNDFYGSGCRCERCLALIDSTFSSGQDADLPGEHVTNPGEYSRIMWNYFRQVAEATQARYPDKYYTTLAYARWRAIPRDMTKLPGNLLVGVTSIANGNSADHPAMKRIFEEIANWNKYTDNGVWLSHYQINRPQYDGIPQPRLWAAGRFYNELANHKIFGIFFESEITHGYQHHLDIYLNHRLMWNPRLDAAAMIDEYAVNMYGAAAPEIIALLHIFEDCYLKGIVRPEPAGFAGAAYRDVVDWPEGRWPGRGMAGLRQEVYTDAKINEIITLAQRAKSKVSPESVEGKRVKLFTDRFVGQLLKKLNIKRNY